MLQGGLEGAIRNYARRGYRFLIEETEPAAQLEDALAQAESNYSTAQWREAMRAFAAADLSHPLGADALERWGIAAQCAGELASAVAPLERAAVVYSTCGARDAAARVLISLARIQICLLYTSGKTFTFIERQCSFKFRQRWRCYLQTTPPKGYAEGLCLGNETKSQFARTKFRVDV